MVDCYYEIEVFALIMLYHPTYHHIYIYLLNEILEVWNLKRLILKDLKEQQIC
jgi:hypothetical protein